MTNQPLDTTALRALATEAIKINEANRPDSPYEIPVKVATFGPQTVLALLDENERLRATMREALEQLSWHDPSIAMRRTQDMLRTALGEGEKHK